MAYIDPTDSFDRLKTRVSDTVKEYFPVKGSKHILEAKKVWVDDNIDIDDVTTQKDSKLKGRTWGVPIKAELQLKDIETGKVIDQGVANIGKLPKITRRYSYIVDGNEWQVNNQLRLKSGVYTRVKDNGELESQWNLAQGMGFRMAFDPASKKMSLVYGGSNIGLYPVLKTLGVSDDEIEKSWGKEIFQANSKGKHDSDIRKLYKTMTGKMPEDIKTAQNVIYETLDKTKLRPDSTALTLGKAYDKVTGPALLTGAGRILSVARGETEPDDRDSLEFKDVLSAEDLLTERLSKDRRFQIAKKLRGSVDNYRSVREIVPSDIFGKHIKGFFTNSSVVDRPDHINPTSFLAGNRRTTLGGEHGIEDERKLTLEMQSINPSQMGFLDPVMSPESSRIGTVLQMALGAEKDGTTLKVRAHNLKTGKEEMIDPITARRSNVAFPDQYRWDRGKPVPVSDLIKVNDRKGEIVSIPSKEVEYVLKSTKGMFDINANMIPFLQNDQGNRTMVAAKQFEQAVPLVHRQAPLVQTASEDGKHTFEEVVGQFTAHRAPVKGTVMSVTKDAITVKDEAGKRHTISIYNDFPLNNPKAFITAEPLVKKGDKVEAGQIVADTNFTKNGVLALGTPLRVAYMPYHGYNFEDAVVVSESAAKKLLSEHMFRDDVQVDRDVILHKGKFRAQTAGQYTTEQIDKLDDDAVVQEGQEVKPGDILIGRMRKEKITPEQMKLGLFHKKFLDPVRPRPITWEHDYPGTVSRVVKQGKNVTVYVKAAKPAEIGDKIVGRHGNKGIISTLIPDAEMPHDKSGKPVEVLFNPAGVPSRINLGQVLETAAGKIAEKTGKPYKVNNFDPNNHNYLEGVRKELEQHGLSDTEDLIDPHTGQVYSKVLVGPQNIMKLHLMGETKMSARARDTYDVNLAPKSGGESAGQKLDTMALYGLLAHNARHNIREAQTYKSEFNDDFWAALQAGEPIPPPRNPPFVYKKFEAYLKAMGVDVTKEGNSLVLSPLTDKNVLSRSNGEIRDPARIIIGKTAKPEPGGLFDPKVTGTRWPDGKFGDKWSHFSLASRMPNPVFEKPIRSLLGMNSTQFDRVLKGEEEFRGKSGPSAVVDALKGIEVDKELSAAEAKIKTYRGPELDGLNKKIKYLRALKQAELDPKEAYTLKNIPVLPSNMQPYTVLEGGDVKYDDRTLLYKGIGLSNQQLKEFPKELPPEEKIPLEYSVYDGMKALMLTGKSDFVRHLNGIASYIAGAGKDGKSSPKEGFFQDKVIGKRQDMSMRATIVPEPSLHIDEVAIPRKAASEVYKPFVSARLVRMGYTPGKALELIRKDDPLAGRALEREVEERPLLLKRDPVLHKYGIQAFRPKLISGHAIKIHPLVTGGYNADFDGDQMSAYVPVSREAVQEARKMFPSNNVFNPSTGNLMYRPGHEALLGLFELSKVGPKRNITFNSPAAAARAAKEGKIKLTDSVKILNVEAAIPLEKAADEAYTTVARLLAYNALPKEKRDRRILTDPDYRFDKKTVTAILSDIAATQRTDFGDAADKLKDLGNNYATGFSIGLDDFRPVSGYRDQVLGEAHKKELEIRANKKSSAQEKREQILELYGKADKRIQEHAKDYIKSSGNRMYSWVESGARGDWDQFRQMVVAPMLVADSYGRPIPVPIDKSYAEGLDIGSYWAAMHGARMGTIGRVEGTAKPGDLTKQMVTTSMDQLVVSEDCGTTKGVSMAIEDRDVIGRFTSEDINLGVKVGKDKGTIPKGSLVTSELLNRFRNNKIMEIPVRSPLKCSHGDGICAKCYGMNEDEKLPELGTNLGVIAAHSMSEPMTQLSMNAFHSGGLVGAKGTGAVNKFDRLEQLLKFPKTLPGSAVLATEDGKVQKIETDPAGGWDVYIQGKRHYVPTRRELMVKPGTTVRRGDALTTGAKNPLELLPLTHISTVQRYLTDELQNTYASVSPVRRRNIETFVRSLTNLSVVENPGDHPELLPNDYAPTSAVKDFNSKLGPGKKPVLFKPLLKGTNVLPSELRDDWLARMQTRNLKSTLMDASAEGWKSVLHGTHPIPGMAYGVTFGSGTPGKSWLY